MKKYSLTAEILQNGEAAPGVWEMTLSAKKIAESSAPGQFVAIGGFDSSLTFHRPFGIADADGDKIKIYYRVIGKGTRIMARLPAGSTVNCRGALGRGFGTDAERPLITGGGMGLAPLLYLAKIFGGAADVLIGGRSRDEVFWTKFFEPLARKIFITTDDGSVGTKGFSIKLLPEILAAGNYDAIYACGPEIMMKKTAEISKEFHVPCQVSLERRMACGLGACLSCAVDGADGSRKKVCKDGPVFRAEEVEW